MKTAEEYLYQHRLIETSNGNDAFRVDDCLEAMKAYAMQECVKVRRECADNVDTEHTFLYSSDSNAYDLVEQSILSTPIELT